MMIDERDSTLHFSIHLDHIEVIKSMYAKAHKTMRVTLIIDIQNDLVTACPLSKAFQDKQLH